MALTFLLSPEDNHQLTRCFGAGYEYFKLIEDKLGIKLGIKGHTLTVISHNDHFNLVTFKKLISYLYDQAKNKPLTTSDFEHLSWDIDLPSAKANHPFKLKNKAQESYIDAMQEHDLVLCDGPAGTGKTFLAVAHAVSLFKAKKYEKLVFARPVVEAGEQLGFLPGDINEKINPYMQPIFDALSRFIKPPELEQLMMCKQIEIAPIAYMRGRTFSNAFVVVDEVQNLTKDQIVMCISRLGHHAKMVLCGDLSQCDLPSKVTSGFQIALDRLHAHPSIAVHSFSFNDIMRHALVADCLRLLGASHA